MVVSEGKLLITSLRKGLVYLQEPALKKSVWGFWRDLGKLSHGQDVVDISLRRRLQYRQDPISWTTRIAETVRFAQRKYLGGIRHGLDKLFPQKTKDSKGFKPNSPLRRLLDKVFPSFKDVESRAMTLQTKSATEIPSGTDTAQSVRQLIDDPIGKQRHQFALRRSATRPDVVQQIPRRINRELVQAGFPLKDLVEAAPSPLSVDDWKALSLLVKDKKISHQALVQIASHPHKVLPDSNGLNLLSQRFKEEDIVKLCTSLKQPTGTESIGHFTEHLSKAGFSADQIIEFNKLQGYSWLPSMFNTSKLKPAQILKWYELAQTATNLDEAGRALLLNAFQKNSPQNLTPGLKAIYQVGEKMTDLLSRNNQTENVTQILNIPAQKAGTREGFMEGVLNFLKDPSRHDRFFRDHYQTFTTIP